MIITVPNLAGVDVMNGSFNGTAPEDCEGKTATEIKINTGELTSGLFHSDCSYHLCRVINSSISISPRQCCHYHSDLIPSAGSRDIPTVQASIGVHVGLGQLAGATTLSILHIFHVCICHPLSVCLQLAVAIWSGGCIPGMGRTSNLSPEMACNGSLCSDVWENPGHIYEDSLSGSVASDCLCSGILHAVV